MAWRMRLRSPPGAGESGQVKQRFTLALALTALALGLLLTAVSVYAIWTNTTSVTPTFDSDTLNPGTGLIAFPSGSNIVISWTASVDTYASGYKVLRGTTSGGPYTEIDTVTPIGATIYTDTSVVVDTTYYYVLQSYYQNWLSADSNQGSATAGAGLVSIADSYVQEDLAGSNFGTATLMDVQSYTTGQTTSLTSVADSYGQEDLADTNFGAATSMDVQSDDDIVTTSFAAVADSYVQENLAGTNFGADTLMDVQTFQDGGSKENRRSLVQFDVSSIPAGSTVSAATLTLCAAVVPGTTRTHDVHRVTSGWVESTVTWNNQPTVVPQKVSASTPATPACMTWTVTATVQGWIDGTANNGWRIEDANEGSNILHLAQYRTREESVVTSERPDLDVTYTAPTQQNRRSFVQFDVTSIPAGSTVNSATLTLCATAVPAATRTYNAYRVTAGWVEGTITWNNQPGLGALTDTATTPATPGCMTWSVAADVQAWVDGTANNGWRVNDATEASATQHLTQFRTREDGAVPAEQPKLDVTYSAPSDQKNRRSFVQFDVSTIPANSNVTFATLTLCATAVPAATRTYELHQVTAAWLETSINWTNQPAVAATATVTKTTPATPGCMTWIVTADVQAWVNGTANNGWRIRDATEGSATQYLSQFRTREEAVVTSDRPKLAVNINAPQDVSFVSTADSYGQEDLGDTNFGAATAMDVQSKDDVVTTSFAAAADTYVQEDLADSSFGSATLMDVQSLNDAGSKENRRSLVQFDVSSIPAGSTVSSASLTLCATVVPASTRNYRVHQVTAGWVETTVTWNNQPATGGLTDTISTPATPGCMSWTVTADVQDWIDGTANNGWRIRDATEGGAGHLTQFRTREESVVTAERPKLDVTYTAPTQQNRRSFVQFDVSSIPAGSNVNSATLTLCATAVPAATRTYDAYRVTAAWVEGSITWNNQPAVDGVATATNTTPGTPGCMTWNVANDVQLWVDGTANDGWRIHDVSESAATQYQTQFRTKEDGAVPAEQPKLDVNYTEPWESVSEAVAAGGTVTTDTEADGATAADQLETWVTSPNAGTVTIIERAATPSPPPEFTFLGQEVNITAPNATAADPLVIKFRLDATLVPPGEDENTIAIFKDGVLVPNCDTFPGSTTAAPDPCVTDRVLLGDGDVEITVLTSTASGWNFGILAPAVCSAGNTGFQSPTAQASDTGGDGNGFELNPSNAFADDAAFASNFDGQDDRHRFSGYDFSSASGCTIQGIEVRFDWWLDSISGTSSMDVELSWDGGTSWTQPRNDPLETDTEHTITFGGSIDLWGHAWTVSDLSSTNFRVRLISNSTSTTRDFFVDWVPVNVYFGPALSDTGYLSPSAEVADSAATATASSSTRPTPSPMMPPSPPAWTTRSTGTGTTTTAPASRPGPRSAASRSAWTGGWTTYWAPIALTLNSPGTAAPLGPPS